MDKLGKIFYGNKKLLYKCKNTVSIPVLGMVDEILSISKYSSSTVATNAAINSFMGPYKLTLSQKKCGKIQIGKKCD